MEMVRLSKNKFNIVPFPIKYSSKIGTNLFFFSFVLQFLVFDWSGKEVVPFSFIFVRKFPSGNLRTH